MTFDLGGLLGQDVTLEGLAALDATTGANRETLLCAALGLHFGHFLLLNDMPSGGSRREHFHYPKALMGTTLLRLLLGRPDDHDHLTAFHLRHLLDLANSIEICLDPFQLTHAELLVRHFATPEAQGHFDLVLFLKEANHVPELDLVIVFVSTWPQFDFLDLHLLLLQLGFVGTLLFLVLELAVIHDATDGWTGHRRDFHEIDTRFLGHLQCLTNADNTQLFAFHTLETNLRNRNFFVEAMRLVLSYGETPENNNN